MAKRLSTLDGMRVEDAQGRKLGHVWDVRTTARASAEEGDSREIAAVRVGEPALLERLGFKRRGGDRLPMKKVAGVSSGHLVVEQD